MKRNIIKTWIEKGKRWKLEKRGDNTNVFIYSQPEETTTPNQWAFKGVKEQ